MSLRPIAAEWFELVTVHKELARVMECLSRTGAVELQARSGAAERLLLAGLDADLKAFHDLARRYQTYWPAGAAPDRRRPERLSETLKSATERFAGWVEQANPIIAAIEQQSHEAAGLEQLRSALQSIGRDCPNLQMLVRAGPKLQVRLLTLPAGTLPREIPSLTLFKPWQTPAANYALAVGRASDIGEIDAQLPGLKAHAVSLPSWLPSSSQDAIAAIIERIARLETQRAELTARLDALSSQQQIAQARGTLALIEWLNENANELRGSERLAWVTGWTSDLTGSALRSVLDADGTRYLLRLGGAPPGLSAPLVLSNPAWARAFEIFARMLGTPGRNESDPSQILVVVASSIFGFMFGDVGQGAIVLLAGLALGRRLPPARMLVPGGMMAIFFGFLFGSVFCREDIIPALWIRPLADPITILAVAVAAGVVIIALGLVLDALQMHWRGEAIHWWGHRAGLLATYAGLLVAPKRLEGLLVAAIGAGWYAVGAVILAGRAGAVVSAAAELVEQTLRLLINTVSFARIGAFALAHAGLSVAIVEIAGASGRVGYWIVLVIGNVLVIMLEGVVVSIQTTRLLLFEFFIRFLTGTGRELKPLLPPVVAAGNLAAPSVRGTS
jgi:V/A-type H+-transporting ATPase subunit I